mmetsp:Transcript_5803/g.9989  ORF Transcript_5803/g.9989 Transcript_5803/m.9989 type:complete len:147 (+) Transcript_5803:2-442(+)
MLPSCRHILEKYHRMQQNSVKEESRSNVEADSALNEAMATSTHKDVHSQASQVEEHNRKVEEIIQKHVQSALQQLKQKQESQQACNGAIRKEVQRKLAECEQHLQDLQAAMHQAKQDPLENADLKQQLDDFGTALRRSGDKNNRSG